MMHDNDEADIDQRLLARFDALAARVEEQATVIAEQRARIALLEGVQPGLLANARSAAPVMRDTTRRGFVKRLLGVAAAAAVLAVAKEPPPAHAFVRGTILGSGGSTPSYGFVGTSGTTDPLVNLPPLGSHTFGLVGTASAAAPSPTFSSAVAGFGSAHGGIMGLSNTNVGAYGQSNSHTGVYGQSRSNAGVYGQSESHAGVYGVSATTGVVGVGSTGAGVQGTSAQGSGVYGESTSDAALYGTSPYAGVYGTSATVGVWGATSTGTAILGQAGSSAGWAGHFVGNVYINGSLTVTGSFPKSAAVPHPDGSYRRMYCQEAPEPYFEDFGRARLVNGQATIPLDPEFAAMIDADDYLVFLTEIGDAGGLFLTSQTSTAFTVQARASGNRDVEFAYRLVSRRKDLSGRRLENVPFVRAAQVRPTPRVLNPNDRPRPTAVNGPDVSR